MTEARPTRRHLLLAGGVTALSGTAACSRTTAGSPAPPGPATAGTTAPATGSPHPTASPRPGATTDGPPPPGPDITHATTGRPEVALTFHGAGDVAILRRMLAEFADAGAHVTVLAIGSWLDAEPQVARLVLDGGHDLGNHTWSHRTLPDLAPGAIAAEIGRAADVLRRVAGAQGRWFRPSGTPHSTPAIRDAAVAAGYGACLGYDVDPLDYADPGPDAVVRAFRAGVREGSLVSLHLGHAGTLAAMPRLLATLEERHLSAVTATALLRTS